MSRFVADKTREESLSEFMTENVYPQVTSDFTRIENPDKQRNGHDMQCLFDWEWEPKIVDEKAQNSDRYICSPAPTFVLELFGESWENRASYGNIGWFLNDDIETDYYVFVWLPDVSLFRINSIFESIEYHPADAVDFSTEPFTEHMFAGVQTRFKETQSNTKLDHYKIGFDATQPVQINHTNGTTNVTLRRDVIKSFEESSDSLPTALRYGNNIELDEWYYDPRHVYEAKVVIVEKKAIEQVLANDGLTKERLRETAIDVIESDTHIKELDSRKVKGVMRSEHNASGCNASETPVNLIVNYSTYHEAAAKKLHYKNGSWDENTRLF